MSLKVQHRCDDCGFVTALSTPAVADYSLRRHSCATQRERDARAQRRLDRLAASGPEQPCQHNGKHPHGNRVRYVIDKCRCRPCRNAASAYGRNLERRRLYGKTIYVPADQARAHVRALQAQGMGWKRIAAQAGIDNSVMWKLLYGDPSRNLAPSKRIRPATETKILAVKLDVAPGQKVDPTGTGRRLQALVALGWSIGQIETRTGLDRQCLDAALHGQGIIERTRAAVAAAYDQLWNQAPPQGNQRERIAASRSRNRAQANGWAPPLAWDDDTIDNPDATPHTAEPERSRPGGGRPIEDLVEDIEFLLDDDPLLTARAIAARLGYRDHSGIQIALGRAERRDLLQRLARNAELANPGHVTKRRSDAA